MSLNTYMKKTEISKFLHLEDEQTKTHTMTLKRFVSISTGSILHNVGTYKFKTNRSISTNILKHFENRNQ